MSNATMERPANLTIETEITRALREQLTDHPRESERLVQRLAQLRADRDPAHQAVIELRIKVRAGLAKRSDLENAEAALDQIDSEIRSLEHESDDYESSRRIIEMELSEQLARQRAKVAPALRAEILKRAAAVSEGLAALQPLVDALLELKPAADQFYRGATVHGFARYHNEVRDSDLRALHFWTGDFNNGCALAELRKRWQEVAEPVK